MTERDPTRVAVDLGATSGRVVTGRMGKRGVEAREVHRFANTPVQLADSLHWNLPALYGGIIRGLQLAGDNVQSLGIDTWGVDYGLIAEDGRLLGLPFHYRDHRTSRSRPTDDVRVFRETGVATQSINTRLQLLCEPEDVLNAAKHLLLMPDLFNFLLTGFIGAEVTIASSTQLRSTAGSWAEQLLPPGARSDLLPPIHRSGLAVGVIQRSVAEFNSLSPNTQVISVAAHDTASALVATPAIDSNFAFISCGTWAVVGVELARPELSDRAMSSGFTNEVGYDASVRFQKNHTGLWVLSECCRVWGIDKISDLVSLLSAAAQEPAFRSIVDTQAPVVASVGDAPARIRQLCGAWDQPLPLSRSQVTRCVIDSLALSFADTIEAASEITGVTPSTVHIVGGGSANGLLCQTIADVVGMTVIAGPTEAAALGNLLLQMDELSGQPLGELRSRIDTDHTQVYRPQHVPGLGAAVARFRSVRVSPTA